MRRSPAYFVFWFPVISTALWLAYLAMISTTPVQSGPGGLTALANIPNFVIFVICLVVIIAGLIFRPCPLISSRIIAVITITLYVSGLIAVLQSPFSGRFNLIIHVVDYSGNPIPNIPVTLSIDRTLSSFSGVLARTSRAELYTNSEGIFTFRAGSGQKIYCSINPLYKRLSPFRSASVAIEPRNSGRFSLNYSWSNKLFDPATNKHFHTENDVILPKELKIFLPVDSGDDANRYIQEFNANQTIQPTR